jgi:hypothetical protein
MSFRNAERNGKPRAAGMNEHATENFTGGRQALSLTAGWSTQKRDGTSAWQRGHALCRSCVSPSDVAAQARSAGSRSDQRGESAALVINSAQHLQIGRQCGATARAGFAETHAQLQRLSPFAPVAPSLSSRFSPRPLLNKR